MDLRVDLPPEAGQEEGLAVAQPADVDPSLVFEVPSCPVKSVVVFLDRAEVCRSVDAKVKSGENELVLRNISSSVDKDSIRVEGQGAAVITEVSFQTKHVTSKQPTTTSAESSTQRELAQLHEELEQLEQRRAAMSNEKNRLRSQRNMLNSFADQLVESAETEGGLVAMTSKQSLDGLDQFLSMYDTQAADLEAKMHELQEELHQLGEKCTSIRKTISEREDSSTAHATQEEREISILLDAQEPGMVHLSIYYVVSNASWAPKYDVRTYVKEARMQIHYFGVIRQSTGEDWRDAKVSLSTAVPGIGGNPPEITAKHLSFLKPDYQYYSLQKASKPRLRSSFRAKRKRREMRGSLQRRLSMSDIEMGYDEAEVQTGFVTTAYEIEKPATIPADNTGHKVLVSVIGLKPSFKYESVPKLAARAYLKAKVKNESPFALLAGPTNIFLEDNFVAKSKIEDVSPQEEFECSLGADPSVRVTYKPVQRFREHSGFVTKTTVFKFRQVIDIKNTQPETITVKVSDQLPLSTEEKIKVNLVEPEVKKPERGKPLPSDAYPRLNNANNIEWQLAISPGEKKELVLRYTVEFPTDQKVDGL